MTETEKAVARLRQWKDGTAPDVQYCAGNDAFARDVTALLAHIDTLAGEWRPLSEWHEDMGPKLWHKFPVTEEPYVGSPLDCGFTVEAEMVLHRHGEISVSKVIREQVGGWPGYHTHFTALSYPAPPKPEVTP